MEGTINLKSRQLTLWNKKKLIFYLDEYKKEWNRKKKQRKKIKWEIIIFWWYKIECKLVKSNIFNKDKSTQGSKDLSPTKLGFYKTTKHSRICFMFRMHLYK